MVTERGGLGAALIIEGKPTMTSGGNLNIQLMSMLVNSHDLIRDFDMLMARSEFSARLPELARMKAAAVTLFDGIEALRKGLPKA